MVDVIGINTHHVNHISIKLTIQACSSS